LWYRLGFLTSPLVGEVAAKRRVGGVENTFRNAVDRGRREAAVAFPSRDSFPLADALALRAVSGFPHNKHKKRNFKARERPEWYFFGARRGRQREHQNLRALQVLSLVRESSDRMAAVRWSQPLVHQLEPVAELP